MTLRSWMIIASITTVAALGSVAACSGTITSAESDAGATPMCPPGQQLACACTNGAMGTQVCNVYGTGYTSCQGCAAEGGAIGVGSSSGAGSSSGGGSSSGSGSGSSSGTDSSSGSSGGSSSGPIDSGPLCANVHEKVTPPEITDQAGRDWHGRWRT